MSNTFKQYIRLCLGIILIHGIPSVLLIISLLIKIVPLSIVSIFLIILQISLLPWTLMEDKWKYAHRIFLLNSCLNCIYFRKPYLVDKKSCHNTNVDYDLRKNLTEIPMFGKCEQQKSEWNYFLEKRREKKEKNQTAQSIFNEENKKKKTKSPKLKKNDFKNNFDYSVKFLNLQFNKINKYEKPTLNNAVYNIIELSTKIEKLMTESTSLYLTDSAAELIESFCKHLDEIDFNDKNFKISKNPPEIIGDELYQNVKKGLILIIKIMEKNKPESDLTINVDSIVSALEQKEKITL